MHFLLGMVWLITLIWFIVLYKKKKNARLAAGENYQNDETYQAISKKKRIVGIVCIASLVINFATGPSNNDAAKETKSTTATTQQTQEKKEEPKAAEKVPEPPKAVQVATLHVTPAVFRQRYNEYLHSQGGEIGASGALDLADPAIQSGSVNDTVAYANNDLNLALNETIDKNTGEIKEVFITSLIAGKDNQTIQASLMVALVSYNALIYAVAPNSNRDTVQEGLGLHQNVGEWAKNTETNHNGIRYFKMVAKGMGLSFGASAQ